MPAALTNGLVAMHLLQHPGQWPPVRISGLLFWAAGEHMAKRRSPDCIRLGIIMPAAATLSEPKLPLTRRTHSCRVSRSAYRQDGGHVQRQRLCTTLTQSFAIPVQ